MRTFLDEIAEQIFNTKTPLEFIKIIVPSRRATLFLKNALARQIQKPTFAPEIQSIEDFIEELSGLKKVPQVDLIFEFYDVYRSVNKEKQSDSFDQFLGWANVILSDFNEMDAHLVATKSFFDFQFSLQEMTQWTKDENQTQIVQNHLQFWRIMPKLYKGLNQRLMEKQQATLGYMFREAVANLEFYMNQTSKQHFFVGFNALNTAESQIIQEFLSRNKGFVYWDIDSQFYKDPFHAAGKFIRQYHKDWKSLRSQKVSFEEHFSKPKLIEIIGVTKNIAQAKYASQLAIDLHQKYPNEKTAVVLGEESLLVPAISSIEDPEVTWNVTMGYPLKDTTATNFFEVFFHLHHQVRKGAFFFKHLKKLLFTSFCRELFQFHQLDLEENLNDMVSKNLNFIPQEKLYHTKDLASIDACFFAPVGDIDIFLKRLTQICNHFILFLENSKDKGAVLHLNYFQKFKSLFNRIQGLNQKQPFIDQLSLLILVFRALIKEEKIDFLGEPLEGIQFMGLLETRLLDFDNVIITNLNEGILPAGKNNDSFLPFDLKKKFKLPTFLENDAIYTYHFYRLLQRAKRVYLLYNTQSDGLNSGEMSRFLYQLKYLKQHPQPAMEKLVGLNYNPPQTPISEIKKTEEIMERLHAIAEKGFSPSSLSLYLRNPLTFYYQRVLGIQQNNRMESTINPMDKGNLVHGVLEQLYLPYQNQNLTLTDFDQMKKQVAMVLEEHYRKIYHGTPKIIGRNYIIFEVLKKSIMDFLTLEEQAVKQGNQIKILFLEHQFEQIIHPPNIDFPVKLVGVVDRIDLYNGQLRIIDYKTGMVQPKQLKLPHWEVFYEDTDFAYLFQILLYSYVQKPLISQYPGANAGIISLRNLPEYFMPFTTKNNPNQSLNPENLARFEVKLFDIIDQIFDSKLNFIDKG